MLEPPLIFGHLILIFDFFRIFIMNFYLYNGHNSIQTIHIFYFNHPFSFVFLITASHVLFVRLKVVQLGEY